MRYTKHLNNLAQALMLTPDDEKRLKGIIAIAYHKLPDKDFSVDEVNALVAPELKTPEEAYYVAQVIITDVMGAASMNDRKKYGKRL